MGIYDREYYRREGPSFLESISGRAEVCKWLIIINVVVFVLQLISHRVVTDGLILDTDAVANGEVWRLLTYAFLHDPHSLWHILFNMLFLWWFGKDMEELYGWKEFLSFYLIAAVIGGLAFQLGWGLDINNPFRNRAYGHMFGRMPGYCLGASGAVTAVLVLYAFHYPRHIIYFFGVVPIPIWLFVGFQVAQDLFGVLGSGDGRTAYTVHLGGAAFGFAYFKLQWRITNLWPDLKGWQRRRSRPKLRVYTEEDVEEAPMPSPVPVATTPNADADEHFEAKVDAVLEKVARSGRESLSESEKELLIRASELARARREKKRPT
jgi:membrane associated rhomboid family serine protease